MWAFSIQFIDMIKSIYKLKSCRGIKLTAQSPADFINK